MTQADSFQELGEPKTAERMEMAVNQPTGDNARNGAVKKRSRQRRRSGGASRWTKRDKGSGEFMAVKKPAKAKKPAKKFKGVRAEKKAKKAKGSKRC